MSHNKASLLLKSGHSFTGASIWLPCKTVLRPAPNMTHCNRLEPEQQIPAQQQGVSDYFSRFHTFERDVKTAYCCPTWCQELLASAYSCILCKRIRKWNKKIVTERFKNQRKMEQKDVQDCRKSLLCGYVVDAGYKSKLILKYKHSWWMHYYVLPLPEKYCIFASLEIQCTFWKKQYSIFRWHRPELDNLVKTMQFRLMNPKQDVK